MRSFISILLLLTVYTASAQWTFDIDHLSDEGEAVLAKIELGGGYVPSDSMGMRSGYLPKDYPLTVLREKLTAEELMELTKHGNPVVRCYGFKALTMKNEAAAFQVIHDHLQDTVKISTAHGCLARNEFVGDFFVDVFQGHEAIVHDSTHLQILDSLLIFTANKLQARHWAIRRAGKKGKYYERIREIAIHDKLGGAVIALAGFKKEADVDIIMETKVTGDVFRYHPLATTFFAITQFPHPKFLPFLEGHFDAMMHKAPSVECVGLYHAISNYNNAHAHELLAQLFEIPDQDIKAKHLNELTLALRRNPHPIYNDLRKKLGDELKN